MEWTKISIYTTAIIGTITDEIKPILWAPPQITYAVVAARIIPKIIGIFVSA